MPRRFGHVPVEEAPLGWDTERRFERVYPRIELPFQEVERVSFGYPDLDENRLYYGDNLHIMRALPSESIDLIYIDPPFFSGRNYNLLFGDKSELRSFSDIWEGGLNGYLVWLNARLYEMKRLLMPTGSLVVHCDWHASHYIKVELDKIFGYEAFRNEIVWSYHSGGASSRYFGRKHDILLWYARGDSKHVFNDAAVRVPYTESTVKAYNKTDEDGRRYKLIRRRDGTEERVYAKNLERGRLLTDVWEDIPHLANWSGEKVGYPTQKPEALLDRIISALSPEGGIVGDFFCGGGTTPAAAQRLERRWLACDISRVAVSLTSDRIARAGETAEGRQVQTSLQPIPDFVVANWGIYDTERLTQLDAEPFREFVVKAYGGRLASGTPGIDGYKGREPLLVGSPLQDEPVTADQVAEFAKACLRRSDADEASGTVLAWTFSREASEFADRLLAQSKTRVRFVRLKLINVESLEFKAHVVEKSEDYDAFLSFVLPPVTRFSAEPVNGKVWRFDATESQSLNPGGNIINVQWDFDFRDFFTSSEGFTFSRSKSGLDLTAEYEFPVRKKWTVACRMQDDVGGQATVIRELDVD